jgi:hypothetical protein
MTILEVHRFGINLSWARPYHEHKSPCSLLQSAPLGPRAIACLPTGCEGSYGNCSSAPIATCCHYSCECDSCYRQAMDFWTRLGLTVCDWYITSVAMGVAQTSRDNGHR